MSETEATKAPGLQWRTRKDGRQVPYWIAPRAAVRAGYRPTILRIHGDDPREIKATCQRLYAEALEFMAGHRTRHHFDGSLGSLIRVYQTDEISPFHRVKWVTRKTYANLLGILDRTVGGVQLHAIGGRDFHRWYDAFRQPRIEGGPERIANASHLMNALRWLFAFGVVIEVPHCDRLRAILGAMKFEGIARRSNVLTAEMVDSFRASAHAVGRPSMALAMALQFETAMRQRDVIGEWEPVYGPSEGALVRAGTRWTTGLTWGAHIDAELVMRKPTSKSRGRKVLTIDLRRCPMVIEELAHIPPSRRVGPVIVSEQTGVPYVALTYTNLWRRIADRAGIPRGVWNMDARAGALTEAARAGVDIRGVQTLATHSEQRTTQGYMRDRETDAVIDARVKHRVKGRNA